MASSDPPNVRLILEPSSERCEHALVGGKARNLWLLGRQVQCKVPQWFCITTEAFTQFVEVHVHVKFCVWSVCVVILICFLSLSLFLFLTHTHTHTHTCMHTFTGKQLRKLSPHWLIWPKGWCCSHSRQDNGSVFTKSARGGTPPETYPRTFFQEFCSCEIQWYRWRLSCPLLCWSVDCNTVEPSTKDAPEKRSIIMCPNYI